MLSNTSANMRSISLINWNNICYSKHWDSAIKFVKYSDASARSLLITFFEIYKNKKLKSEEYIFFLRLVCYIFESHKASPFIDNLGSSVLLIFDLFAHPRNVSIFSAYAETYLVYLRECTVLFSLRGEAYIYEKLITKMINLNKIDESMYKKSEIGNFYNLASDMKEDEIIRSNSSKKIDSSSKVIPTASKQNKKKSQLNIEKHPNRKVKNTDSKRIRTTYLGINWGLKQKIDQGEEVLLPTRTPEEERFYKYSEEHSDDNGTIDRNTSIPELSSASFLKKMGYDTNTTWDKRKQLLENAVAQYDKRKIIRHLSFLVDTRKAQKNGETKFANAISIWEHDINFVERLM